ncbi:MAG: FMN-binding protein, partial [Victivallales bacterium]|nr:FMN-binding protein [Victivallales bacterium]
AWLLEIGDTLGGAAGGLLMAWGLLPLLGPVTALWGLGLLTAGGILLAGISGLWRRPRCRAGLLTAVVFLVPAAMPLRGDTTLASALPLKHYFSPPVTAVPLSLAVHGKTYTLTALDVSTSGRRVGYIIDSGQFAPEVRGYGGPIRLTILVDATGKLLDFVVGDNRETPRFLQRVMAKKTELLGHNIFTGAVGFSGDAVTGATFSARGITAALNLSGRRCAAALHTTDIGGTTGDKSAPNSASVSPSTSASVSPSTSASVSPLTSAPVSPSTSASVSPPPGGPRDIDGKVYRRMIEAGKLSSHRALYWHDAD